MVFVSACIVEVFLFCSENSLKFNNSEEAFFEFPHAAAVSQPPSFLRALSAFVIVWIMADDKSTPPSHPSEEEVEEESSTDEDGFFQFSCSTFSIFQMFCVKVLFSNVFW